MKYEEINKEIIDFVKERDWEKFHSPKNISMALSVEASELAEIFQWQDNASFEENKEEIIKASKEEIADIFYYVVRMCQILDANLEEAFFEKMKKNRSKYPKEEYKSLSTWKKKN